MTASRPTAASFATRSTSEDGAPRRTRRHGARPPRQPLTGLEVASVLPRESRARTARYGLLERSLIAVSNAALPALAITDSFEGLLPPSTCQRASAVEPFQLA